MVERTQASHLGGACRDTSSRPCRYTQLLSRPSTRAALASSPNRSAPRCATTTCTRPLSQRTWRHSRYLATFLTTAKTVSMCTPLQSDDPSHHLFPVPLSGLNVCPKSSALMRSMVPITSRNESQPTLWKNVVYISLGVVLVKQLDKVRRVPVLRIRHLRVRIHLPMIDVDTKWFGRESSTHPRSR